MWYLLYCSIRAFYVSVWYYFAPLIAVMLSYIVATYLAWTEGKLAEEVTTI